MDTLTKKSMGQILTDAAAIIEEHGWTQCRLVDEEGRRCVNGAIVAATHGLHVKSWAETGEWGPGRPAEAACNFLSDFLGLCSPHKWNNSLPRDTGQAIVVRALRDAAECCGAEGKGLCAVGGLLAAVTGRLKNPPLLPQGHGLRPMYLEALTALSKKVGNIAHWNNALPPETGRAAVTLTMRSVAAALRSQREVEHGIAT